MLCNCSFLNSMGHYNEYYTLNTEREKGEHLYETWPDYLKHWRQRSRMDEYVMLVLRYSMSSAVTLTLLS